MTIVYNPSRRLQATVL